MTKHSRFFVFMAAGLVGFIGQRAAVGATTNSVWDVAAISSFSAGKEHVVETNAATAVFLSDGTCSVLVGDNELTGTYTNNTKQLMLTLDQAGLAALASNAVDLVTANIPPGITITVKSVKAASKMSLKNGIPSKSTDTVGVVGSETVGGKTKSKSASVKTLLTNWTLSSGVIF